MRLYPFVLFFGILSGGIYAMSWLFEIMDWEGVGMLRLTAIAPFAIGTVLLIIYNIQLARKKEKEDFDDWLNGG